MLFELTDNRFLAAVYAVAIGLGGCLVLMFFLSGLMGINGVHSAIAWIVGFNALLTGFNLVEKTRGRISKRIYGVLVGMVVGLGSYGAWIGVVHYLWGGWALVWTDPLVLLFVGGVCGGFGSMLACKYRDY